MHSRSSRPAFFLDRDGVLVEEAQYLGDPAGVKILPTVVQALGRIASSGYGCCVVTNQSGIARGYFDVADLERVNARIRQLLAAEGVSAGTFYACPHHPAGTVLPWNVACNCRKPQPGLLLAASAEQKFDLPRSFMIGDKLSDLEAGAAAGCRTILVRSGYGRENESAAQSAGERLRLVDICDTLLEAVETAMRMHPTVPAATTTSSADSAADVLPTTRLCVNL